MTTPAPEPPPAALQTRGRRGRCWTLITPVDHYASALPGLRAQKLVKLVTPRLAPARFSEVLLELAAGDGTDQPLPAEHEAFVYVLDGTVVVGGDDGERDLGPGGWAYVPPTSAYSLHAEQDARLLWLRRPYEPWPGLATPGPLTGARDPAAFAEIPTAPGLHRGELLPNADPAMDFTMSLMSFDPGASLTQVEIHDEEHGLYLLSGSGVYHLDGHDLEIHAGDFIYMAPYCPQTFIATGTEPAEYLLYKDVFRTGF